MRIGDLAGRAGVNVQTIRYYERRRLLLPAARRRSGYREYTDDAVLRVRFIKRAQELGFRLREIGELLALRDQPPAPAEHVRRVVQGKVADIEGRIHHLSRMRDSLVDLLAVCEEECGGGAAAHCTILEALDDSSCRCAGALAEGPGERSTSLSGTL